MAVALAPACTAAMRWMRQNRCMSVPSRHPVTHAGVPLSGRRARTGRRWMAGLLLACSVWLAPLSGASAWQDAATPVSEPAPWAPRSGDAWVDETLEDMNAYAARHRDAFVDELARYQEAPRALVEEALSGGAMPGDVYYACAAAQALGRPCRELLETAGDEGWAARVRSVDADGAEAALLRVKRGIVDSYARWARPVRLDTTSRRSPRAR